MSLYASLYSGVSGLGAYSNAMGMISDNITNINTVGYKGTKARFSTLVTESASTTNYSPGGVAALPRNLIDQQGLLQSSNSATDMGIEGQGFFIVSASGNATNENVEFTRAGNFVPDSSGYLRNTAGQYLLGYPLDAQGNPPLARNVNNLEKIRVASLTGTAEATKSIEVRANLQSSQDTTLTTAAVTAANTAATAAATASATSVTDATAADGTPGSAGLAATALASATAARAAALALRTANPGPNAAADAADAALKAADDALAAANTHSATLTSVSSAALLAAVNAADAAMTAAQTATAALSGYAVGNMSSYSASTTTGKKPDFESNITVYDAQGVAHDLTLGFKKTAPNTWAVEGYVVPASDLAVGASNPVFSGDLAFNSDGTYNAAGTSAALKGAVPIAWSNGATANSVTIDWGTDGKSDGFTQFGSLSAVISSSTDGAKFGNVNGVAVNEDGVVTALFDNGLVKNVYQLPIVTFQNPDGLNRRAGNAYSQSNESGAYSIQLAGTGGAGKIKPGTLEASTVDLAEEFTQLITVQRGYSAAAKVITTADEMLQELNQLKR